MKPGLYCVSPVLALGLIGVACAGAPFERGIRTTLGPSLAKDTPPESIASVPVPSAVEQATAVARAVVQKVDPSSKGVLKRQELDSSKAKNSGSAASSGRTQTGALNTQEKKVGAGAQGVTAEDAAKRVHQLQRGLINDQKAAVGNVQ